MHLKPKSLHDWVADDRLKRFVMDLIDQFDAEGRLTPFYARCREDGWGNPAYQTRLLLKVLVFGYSQGIRSLRKPARLFERNITFRFLPVNHQPDIRSISDLRQNHEQAIEALFEKILNPCRNA